MLSRHLRCNPIQKRFGEGSIGNQSEVGVFSGALPPALQRSFDRIIPITLLRAARLSGPRAWVYVSSVILDVECRNNSCTTFTSSPLPLRNRGECASKGIPSGQEIDDPVRLPGLGETGNLPQGRGPPSETPLIRIFGAREPPVLTCTAAWPRLPSDSRNKLVNL